MIDLTRWDNNRVLYFGDHPYADLADLNLNHGWRTGAIIQVRERERETSRQKAPICVILVVKIDLWCTMK